MQTYAYECTENGCRYRGIGDRNRYRCNCKHVKIYTQVCAHVCGRTTPSRATRLVSFFPPGNKLNKKQDVLHSCTTERTQGAPSCLGWLGFKAINAKPAALGIKPPSHRRHRRRVVQLHEHSQCLAQMKLARGSVYGSCFQRSVLQVLAGNQNSKLNTFGMAFPRR